MSSLSWTKDSIQDQEYQNFFETFSNNESYFNNSLSSSNFLSPVQQTNRSASEIPANYINLMATSNGIEIDVKPKPRFFATKEEKRQFTAEYRKKLKTELCKTFTLKGTCKFGRYCSFAHGKEELKQKIHLSSNYKTKPCKQYFYQGVCSYGYRCQYLHDEIKNDTEKLIEYQDFLADCYAAKETNYNFFTKMQYSFSIRLKRFANMISMHEDKGEVLLTNNEGLFLNNRMRSSFF